MSSPYSWYLIYKVSLHHRSTSITLYPGNFCFFASSESGGHPAPAAGPGGSRGDLGSLSPFENFVPLLLVPYIESFPAPQVNFYHSHLTRATFVSLPPLRVVARPRPPGLEGVGGTSSDHSIMSSPYSLYLIQNVFLHHLSTSL